MSTLVVPQARPAKNRKPRSTIPLPSWLKRAKGKSLSLKQRRALDLITALFLLILATPVLIIVFAAVWITLGPGVIYLQRRIGYKGKPFSLPKFRTLTTADPEKTLISRNDPRITSLGKFLRRHHLDELPQLLTVILGNMSMVGPRPTPVWLADLLKLRERIPEFESRHMVLPGATGLATLCLGRNDSYDGWRNKFALDIAYERHYDSLGNYLRILWRTIPRILFGDPGNW